jgi:hypothetical protein
MHVDVIPCICYESLFLRLISKLLHRGEALMNHSSSIKKIGLDLIFPIRSLASMALEEPQVPNWGFAAARVGNAYVL